MLDVSKLSCGSRDMLLKAWVLATDGMARLVSGGGGPSLGGLGLSTSWFVMGRVRIELLVVAVGVVVSAALVVVGVVAGVAVAILADLAEREALVLDPNRDRGEGIIWLRK